MENTLLIIIIVTIGILFYLFRDKISSFFKVEEVKLPYEKKEFLLNIPERKFFEGLQKIVSDKYFVFPQILLSSIIDTNAKGEERMAYWNKINKKTIDFVIFSKPYLTPLLGIEYDGKTHKESNRKSRDEFVNNVLNSSGIKCLHIDHKKNIDFMDIKNEIEKLLDEGNY